MDYAEPRWLAIMGQLVSYGAGFPVFVVTSYGILTNIYRSNLRWRMPVIFAVLSMYGWAAGIVPAIVDGTIKVNVVMHNTDWVPGHFHWYLIMGVLPMVLAFLYHVIGSNREQPYNNILSDKVGIPVFIVGAFIFVLAFLDAGHMSVPRRMAVHLPQWVPYDKAGSIGAILIILGMLIFVIRIIAGLSKRAPSNAGAANTAG
ncbi:MAG: cbb3-type cytochrome c oxidase subunit I, partial [Gammaproteobacteria bacterium]